MDDPFSILGIRREGSSHADIRRAYHQKAKEHHPDKGGSVENFQRIQTAFDNAMSYRPSSFRSHFSEQFNDMFNRPSVVIKRYDYKVDLETLFTGDNIDILGTSVNIPPNTPINSIININNISIQLRIRPKRHDVFNLDSGNNLILNEQISLYEALTGFNKRTKLPSGRSVLLKIRRVQHFESSYIMRKIGLPTVSGTPTDLIVNIRVIMPTDVELTDETVAMMRTVFKCNIPDITETSSDDILYLNELI